MIRMASLELVRLVVLTLQWHVSYIPYYGAMSAIDMHAWALKILIKDLQNAIWLPWPAMFFMASLRYAFPLLIFSSFTVANYFVEEGQNPVCSQIDASISSSSGVYYQGTIPYLPSCHDVLHRLNRRSIVFQRRGALVKLQFTSCEMCRRTRDPSWRWNYRNTVIYFTSFKQLINSPKARNCWEN